MKASGARESEIESVRCTGLCPVCRQEIHSSRVVCTRCRTNHHADCWRYSNGCSVFGCGQAGDDADREQLAAEDRFARSEASHAGRNDQSDASRRLVTGLGVVVAALTILCTGGAGGRSRWAEPDRDGGLSRQQVEQVVAAIAVRQRCQPIDRNLARMLIRNIKREDSRRMLELMSDATFLEKAWRDAARSPSR